MLHNLLERPADDNPFSDEGNLDSTHAVLFEVDGEGVNRWWLVRIASVVAIEANPHDREQWAVWVAGMPRAINHRGDLDGLLLPDLIGDDPLQRLVRKETRR